LAGEGEELGQSQQRFIVLLIASFAADEPIEAVLEAMRRFDGGDLRLLVSGDPTGLTSDTQVPESVQMTGFLPQNSYDALVRSVDAVMVLTSSEYVMLCGCYEAISAGKPLVTSSTEVLRDYFEPAIFVDNTPDEIYDALNEVRARKQEMSARTIAFRETIREEWNAKFAQLLRLCDREFFENGTCQHG
jgi:glycosyltransferase involved in cell wall biosynthesis